MQTTFGYQIVKPALKGTSILQITIYKGQPHFPPLMNSAYNGHLLRFPRVPFIYRFDCISYY